MANDQSPEKGEIEDLDRRLMRIEHYLFGGGPGGPGAADISGQLEEIRSAISELESKTVTREDIDEVIERIAKLRERRNGDDGDGIVIPTSV